MELKFTITFYVFTITLFTLIVVFRYMWGRQNLKGRLAATTEGGNEEDFSAENPLRRFMKKTSRYFESSSWAMKQEERLVQAGIPLQGAEFMVVSLAMVVASTLILLLVTKIWWLAIMGGMLSFFLPTLVVKQKIKRKKKQLNVQLPPVLTLMANSMRSGYSYMQAMDLVAREVPDPLGGEFMLVLKEMNLGITMEEAFSNMVKRVNMEDLDLVVTAFLIQRQVGGNLVELLDNISETLRGRITMRGRIKTLTAQGKMSGVILCLLPVFLGIVIYLFNGEYIIPFFSHPAGQVMIGLAVGLQVIGIWWMRKVIDIDV